MGTFTRALDVAAEGLAIAEQADHPHSIIFACHGLGVAHARRGDLDAGIVALERGRTLALDFSLPAVLLELTPSLASAYARVGRPGDAVTLLEQAIAQAITLKHRLGHWLRTGGLGEAFLCAGRLDEAVPLLDLHVQLTRMVNARGSHAWALRLAGEAGTLLDPPKADGAETSLQAALALARELGMRPLAARCQLDLGVLYRRLSRGPDARMVLTEAAAAFRALEMPHWSRRADTELAAVDC
jgi:tetratricopeptide (TPR) repeat protein